MAGFAVAGIDAPDAAGVGGRRILMPAGDEVDRDHVRHEVAVRMRGGCRFTRLLHRHAGGVVDMDAAATAGATLRRQMPAPSTSFPTPTERRGGTSVVGTWSTE